MRITLHSKGATGKPVVPRVERIPVVCFNTVMRVEEVAAGAEHTAAVRCAVLDSFIRRARDVWAAPGKG